VYVYRIVIYSGLGVTMVHGTVKKINWSLSSMGGEISFERRWDYTYESIIRPGVGDLYIMN